MQAFLLKYEKSAIHSNNALKALTSFAGTGEAGPLALLLDAATADCHSRGGAMDIPSFRSLEEHDLPMMQAWLQQPHVAEGGESRRALWKKSKRSFFQ